MEEYNEKFVTKFRALPKILELCDKVFHSEYYLIFLVATSVLGFALNAEVTAIFVLLLSIALNLATCRDMTPSFVATVLIALVPMKFANSDLSGFFVLGYSAIFLIPAIALRFLLFPFKFVFGKNLIPLCLYSVVLLLGGIGSDITAKEYFAVYPIYTVLGLGLLQVIIYLFWQSYTNDATDKSIIYFCKSMCAVALACLVLVIITYAEYHINNPADGFNFITVSWKNYIADVFMLTMPFAFFLATRTKDRLRCIGFVVYGLSQYIAIIFTQSAGGIAFATIMIPFLIGLTLNRCVTGNRKLLFIVFGLLGVLILLFVSLKSELFIELYKRKIESGGSSRTTLYKLAVNVFKKYPIFGAGYGHVEQHMVDAGYIMSYYHSTFFHAIAATGIAGFVGYAYMAFFRLKTFVKKYTFNLFLSIAFLGFAGYSMVDVGTAIPFPFVAMCTFMLVVSEKYNDYRKNTVNVKIDKI